jgi:UDP-N-acetylmuramate: L-alanyl-gamma-D-glutamyl-meso-diaminopimelate ligase
MENPEMSATHSDIWFIGIGGVAMGGLAIALARRGQAVTGSDAGIYPPMSTMLAQAGIAWREGFDGAALRDWAMRCPGRVVVGNAIPRGNPELEAALELGLPLTSFPELLRAELLPRTHPVVVAGTHGKTTTANLAACILHQGGLEPGWLIGGRPDGLPSSVEAAKGLDAPFVVEGDEYDTAFWDKRSKFFHYWPRTLVINHLEFDHADIFHSLTEIETAFRRLVNFVPGSGRVLVNGDCAAAVMATAGAFCPVLAFGEGPGCAWRLLDEHPGEEGSVYLAEVPSDAGWLAALPAGAGAGPQRPPATVRIKFPSRLGGVYNGRNLLAGLAIGERFGLPREQILASLAAFRGPGRRMERVALGPGAPRLYDDFGHHPTAVREALAALRLRHPGRRITALVEPRSNTSVRNVMQGEWQVSLAGADAVVMGALHRPWKYDPGELFDFRRCAAALAESGTSFHQIDEPQRIVEHLAADLVGRDSAGELWVIFSNGSFGGLRELLKERFGE